MFSCKPHQFWFLNVFTLQVFESNLIHQIIERLKNDFEEEKHIECILHVLKNVGFTLRKDDPLALKSLILDIQKKATAVREETKKEKYDHFFKAPTI